MTTTATDLPVYTSVCTILARDFSTSTADVNRDRWTPGKLRHVIAALAGVPVVVTVDRQTGHTLVGAQLVRAFNGGPGRGERVAIKIRFADGTENVTNYYLPSVGGAITPLARPEGCKSDPKWVATDSYRREVSAAIQTAQARHGECEGRCWGAWSGECAEYGVMVSYRPSTGNPHYKDKWGTMGAWRITDGPIG